VKGPVESRTGGDDLARLPASLLRVVQRLDTRSSVEPAEIQQLLVEAAVTPEDLEPWADFEHPASHGYGRQLAYRGSNFELMVISWAPGDFSAIHDHGGTQWGAVQVFGPAEHACFGIRNGQLSTLTRQRLQPGEVVAVSHELVHQMGNPGSTRFTSLHIYGTSERVASVTADARVFDPEHKRILRVDGGVFFLLSPAEVKRQEPGPHGDPPTVLRDLGEQIRRLRRMTAADGAHAERLADAITHWSALYRDLAAFARRQDTNAPGWIVLNEELNAAARLKEELD